MKKRIMTIAILFVAIISYANAENIKGNDQEVISNAFEKSKSKFEHFNTSYNGEISNEFLSVEELEKKAKEYIDVLDIEEEQRDIVEEKNMNQISIYGQVDTGEDLSLIFYSYLSKNGLEKSTIFIDVSGNDNYKKLQDIGSKISEILKKQNVNTDNASCIIGTYEGKLESQYKMEIVENLIASTKSQKVESLVDENVISYSLYSKNIEDYIYSGKNKINLNIAIRYNEYKDETYIFIATPVITMGY